MTTVTYCPLCKQELWREEPFQPKPFLQSDDPDSIVFNFSLARALQGERKAAAHMTARHPLRYWLWKRTHWKRALGVHT